jgi:hypothetical protein
VTFQSFKRPEHVARRVEASPLAVPSKANRSAEALMCDNVLYQELRSPKRALWGCDKPYFCAVSYFSLLGEPIAHAHCYPTAQLGLELL